MKQISTWFTFIELIVATTILVILTTLGFYSYSEYLIEARDTQRVADFASVGASLKLYKQKRGAYPLPGNSFTILNGTTEVAKQWLLDTNVTLTTLDSIPSDPYAKVPYFYSVTSNKTEYQLAATLENNGNNVALLEWSYKTVSKNILPSIMLAVSSSVWVDITIPTNASLFILNRWSHNLPYDLETKFPYSDGSDTWTLLSDSTILFWQNTDYLSCLEIQNASKNIGDWEYQILNWSGVLTNTWCIFP